MRNPNNIVIDFKDCYIRIILCKLPHWKDEAFVTKVPNYNHNTFGWIDINEMYSNDYDRIKEFDKYEIQVTRSNEDSMIPKQNQPELKGRK